jgi:hypothetical protein
MVVFLQHTLKEKLPIFLVNTLLLHIPLLALTDPLTDRQSVGRRGTNQLRLLERYLDVLDKHTTGIPPQTALVEGTALSALVEGVSLR